ncbi:hypothetical protein MNBD_NITROSPINAE04-1531 [hydrothermal vent metagenome]|uniref:Lipoprotein n=1 Tax=hydrothermal vent metagenome TaxID=652676 RepID=A0A3B1C5N1_9ZZZZ
MKLNRFLICLMVIAATVAGSACSGVSQYRYWNIYAMTEPAPSTEKLYDDGKIKIRFWIDEKKIHFRFSNLTSQMVTINWRKAVYIHTDGKKYHVANIDSIFSDRKDDPPPSQIPPGKTVDDFLAPSKNVEKLEEWTWYAYPLFNLFNERASDNEGKMFGVDMPVKAEGKWRTYKFRFKITSVVPGVRRL